MYDEEEESAAGTQFQSGSHEHAHGHYLPPSAPDLRAVSQVSRGKVPRILVIPCVFIRWRSSDFCFGSIDILLQLADFRGIEFRHVP